MIDPANVTHLARDLKSALKAVRNPLSSPDQHPRLLLAVVYPISLHSIAIINSWALNVVTFFNCWMFLAICNAVQRFDIYKRRLEIKVQFAKEIL